MSEPQSIERLDAIIKAVAPGDVSDEIRDVYYNVHLLEVAAPDYVHKYLKGEISDTKVYEDLNDIIDTEEKNFWGAVKEQLNG